EQPVERNGLELRAEADLDRLAHDDGHRERGHQRRLAHGARLERGLVAEAPERLEGYALEPDAGERPHRHDDEQHHDERRREGGDDHEPGKGADRVDLAMGEVDDVEHAEDQREADGHQGIDHAERQADGELLQIIIHRDRKVGAEEAAGLMPMVFETDSPASWPGSSRPSAPLTLRSSEAWMPATGAGMTAVDRTAAPAARSCVQSATATNWPPLTTALVSFLAGSRSASKVVSPVTPGKSLVAASASRTFSRVGSGQAFSSAASMMLTAS